MMREAYVDFLNGIYKRNATDAEYNEDVSKLKVNELANWLRAWKFMGMCGFGADGQRGNDDHEDKDED